jgi:Peptidase family M1 domain
MSQFMNWHICWFGDMITCKDWSHGWLNEGFATYCEGLWIEHEDGIEAYHDYVESLEYFQAGSLYLEDDSDPFSIFIPIIYYKGAYVLHMLRGILGDSLFFESLSKYANNDKFRYKHATTEDFKNICEDVSGINLTKFFEQWIYGEYFPHYAYGYSVDSLENNFKINLEIGQVQDNTGLFWMPIDIKVTTSSGEQIFVVWDSLQTQTFELLISEKPLSVDFDPDNWILKEVSTIIVNPPLDKGVLLVNGLDWRTGSEVYDAYNNNAFWGDTKISFWDTFEEPSQGYPSSLPDTIGTGKITNSVISNYSTLLWLSEFRTKDIDAWRNIKINSYLNAGGNIILIAKRGNEFIQEGLRNYVGLNWDESIFSTIKNMKSVDARFTDIDLIADNSVAALFDTTFTQDYSELIYISTESFDSPKGSGVWSKPEGKGQFVYCWKTL